MLVMFAIFLSAGVLLLVNQPQNKAKVFADSSGEEGQIVWSISNNVLTLSKKDGTSGRMSSLSCSGSNETIFSPHAWGYSNYTSVVIEEGVTTLGSCAFSGSAIVDIEIPNSVTLIDNIFENCTSLTTINIGTGLERIGSDFDCYVPNLESVTFYGSTAPDIESDTFYFNTEYTIYVPEGSMESYEDKWGEYTWFATSVQELTSEETGVFVDIVLPTMFVGIVFALAVMYINLGKKKKRAIIG